MSKAKKHIKILFSQAQKHHHARQFAEAQKLYAEILTEIPEHSDALNLLGTALAQSGEPGEGIEYLQRAIDLRPDLAPFRVNLGVIFQDLGEFDKAKECYEHSIKIDETLGDAHYNLAKLYKQIGDTDAALNTYKHLLTLVPERQDALVNMGNIHFDNGSLEKAIVCLKKASMVNSGNNQLTDQAIINLANTYRRQGEDVRAIETYERVLSIQCYAGLRIKQAITLPVVYRDHLHIKDARQRLEKELAKILDTNLVVLDPALEIAATNFFLTYQGLSNKTLQEKTAQVILKSCPALGFIAPHCDTVKSPDKKIKIGFLSAYFRRHSIGRLMQGLIHNISKDKFEVIVLTPCIHDDEIACSIQGGADKVVVFPDDTFEAQRVIAGEKLDILFYADLGMDIRTYFLAFARFAPVQCVSWGHPDTTGIPNMDYFISSNLIEVDGAEDHYSEKLYTLNVLPTYYYPIDVPSIVKTKNHFGCPSFMTLYLCPQSAIKHHPDLDFIFGSILRSDKNSMIMVIEGVVSDWTLQIQRRWGKSIQDVQSRIKIISRQTPEDFIILQNVADVILDTPHFSGGNTSLEAFALAKPIVTLDGEFMRGRVTAGMYRAMGVHSCIAKSIEEYIKIALKLGLDLEFREEISSAIKDSNSVLFNNNVVISEFEDFFISVIDGL